ncbi:hypothetical protein EYF80_030530 [Liparis tanakae]|uniref:Uncharacterized protein n=1 Tax=Liparis tanakae TaxID=230148 RepID=A0A4Z2H1N2_9TELE|nr:hypothetical protein EYF80_030530 [Liparis tanakae]
MTSRSLSTPGRKRCIRVMTRGPTLAIWMMTVRYEGRYQPSGISGTIRGSSTHIPLMATQEPIPKRHARTQDTTYLLVGTQLHRVLLLCTNTAAFCKRERHYSGCLSPCQGSFLTRNSSRAVQPPPTLTINVLRRMRTIRN